MLVERGAQAVEPDHADAFFAGRRPEAAERALAGDDLRARLGQRRLRVQRHDTPAGGAAMPHAAHHLLPDVAALLEGDAMQGIHAGVERKGIAEDEVDPPLRNGKRYAMPVPLRGRCIGCDRACGRNPPFAKRSKTRIVKRLPSPLRGGAGGGVARGLRPSHERGKIRRDCDLHLRPQPIKRQPLRERLRLPGPHIRGKTTALLVQHEIPENFSLRRQQRAIAAAMAFNAVHVVRHDILQKRHRIRSGDVNNFTVIEASDGHCADYSSANSFCRSRPP